MKVEKGSDEIIEDKNCCHKQTHRTKEEKKIVNDRLNRIEGQIKGIKKMIDEDRYCNDVLIQLSAVENSIRSLSNLNLLRILRQSQRAPATGLF